ncbi:class I SAM-dependent methyltransferase [Candidatus Woesebacteria bacterium]|nr:class I SAM-dependent methyltransferase [Candidatus Woesebacteria bacterium]
MNQATILKQIGWNDYELIDSGDGERLERFGEFVLRRPYPEIIWNKSQSETVWDSADAVFTRIGGDKGYWQTRRQMPESWKLPWNNVAALVHLSPFKHTGVFPEQSAHWVWMQELLAKRKIEKPEVQPQILNLFAYTGMASVVCTKAGAKVTHVDSSRSAIGWAKQNQLASGLDERSIRWILDDVLKFVTREVKRGVKYDGIIMDPPAYGHGASGEIWDFKSSFPKLLELCKQILVADPVFVLVNAYAVELSVEKLKIIVQDKLGFDENLIEYGELVLEESSSETGKPRLLSTGNFARFGKDF